MTALTLGKRVRAEHAVLALGKRVRASLPVDLTAQLRANGVQSFIDGAGQAWEWSSFKTRYVRTAAGSRRYGLPIGAPIVGKGRKPTSGGGKSGGGGDGDSGGEGAAPKPGAKKPPAKEPAAKKQGGKVKLTPAQRDAAERHLGREPSAGRGAYLDGNELVVEDRDTAVKALDKILADPDLTPGERKARKNLRDKIAATDAGETTGDDSPPGGGEGADRAPDVAEPEVPAEPAADDTSAPDAPASNYKPGARQGPEDWAGDSAFPADLKSRGWQPGNAVLAEVWRRQGFDGKPRVVSADEFDALPDDHVRVYRGISEAPDINSVGQAGEWAEEYRSGDSPFAGRGVYGDGTYATVDRPTAEAYAQLGPKGTDGAVLDMAIDPNAKVIKYDDFIKLSGPWLRKLHETSPGVAKALGSEPGVLASAMGYDAIEVPNPSGSTSGTFYVVMNRSALFVREAEANR